MKDIYIAYAVLLELNYKFNYKKNNLRYLKTEFETNVLKRIFKINSYPSRKSKNEIGCFLQMPYRSVEIFFQNRRSKYKKMGITCIQSDTKITYTLIISVMVDEILNLNKP